MLLNIVVLAPVCAGLITNEGWVRASYGAATAVRQILLSIYLAIGLVSKLLLALREPQLVAALLLVQVADKLTTPLTVGTLHNPVVIRNLLDWAFLGREAKSDIYSRRNQLLTRPYPARQMRTRVTA